MDAKAIVAATTSLILIVNCSPEAEDLVSYTARVLENGEHFVMELDFSGSNSNDDIILTTTDEELSPPDDDTTYTVQIIVGDNTTAPTVTTAAQTTTSVTTTTSNADTTLPVDDKPFDDILQCTAQDGGVVIYHTSFAEGILYDGTMFTFQIKAYDGSDWRQYLPISDVVPKQESLWKDYDNAGLLCLSDAIKHSLTLESFADWIEQLENGKYSIFSYKIDSAKAANSTLTDRLISELGGRATTTTTTTSAATTTTTTTTAETTTTTTADTKTKATKPELTMLEKVEGNPLDSYLLQFKATGWTDSKPISATELASNTDIFVVMFADTEGTYFAFFDTTGANKNVKFTLDVDDSTKEHAIKGALTCDSEYIYKISSNTETISAVVSCTIGGKDLSTKLLVNNYAHL